MTDSIFSDYARQSAEDFFRATSTSATPATYSPQRSRLGNTATTMNLEEEQDDVPTTADDDVDTLAQTLDVVCGKIRQDVLNMFFEAKGGLSRKHAHDLANQRKTHAMELLKRDNINETLKEDLAIAQKDLAHKREVITRMAMRIGGAEERKRALATTFRSFDHWHLVSREGHKDLLLGRFAERHWKQNYLGRIIRAWREYARVQRLTKYEALWKSKMDSVTTKLVSEYETQLMQLRRELKVARTEIDSYQEGKAKMEDNMRKAFLRGVCALNMEAMQLMGDAKSTESVSELMKLVSANNENVNTSNMDPSSSSS